MNDLNTIPNQGNFGIIVNTVNTNFSIVKDAISKVEYSTTLCKGMYASSTALQSVVPSPKVGEWALIGQAFPCDIYVCNTAGTWVDSGSDYSGDSVDLNDYVALTTYNAFVASTTAALNALNGYFASGGVVAGHTAAIDDLYDILQERTESIGEQTTAINDLQDDVAAHGTRLDHAETNIGQIHEQDTAQDEFLALHNTAINDLQTDVRNMKAAISMIDGGGGGGGLTIVAKSQSEYDALETKDANTLYLII